MPHLAGAGTYQDNDEAGAPATSAGVTHVSAAPSAPDPLSGGWWKYDVVRRLLAADPERLLIWVDDDLAPGSPYQAWADDHPQVRVMGPDPAVGLSPADLDTFGPAAGPERGGRPPTVSSLRRDGRADRLRLPPAPGCGRRRSAARSCSAAA